MDIHILMHTHTYICTNFALFLNNPIITHRGDGKKKPLSPRNSYYVIIRTRMSITKMHPLNAFFKNN